AGAPQPGQIYDPRSTEPRGLAGLVDLLNGAEVEVSITTERYVDTSTYVFIPDARVLSDEEAAELLNWADRGRTAVVAGSASRLGLQPVAASFVDAVGATARRPDCPAPALAHVEAVEHGGWSGFAVPDDTTACFATAEGAAWLVQQEHGGGTVVAVGSVEP